MKDYDGSESARRFFVNCEHEFKDLTSIRQWIYRVEACFIGKAASWVNQQSELQDILDLEEPDEEDKQRFISLIRQKYPDRKPLTRKQWMTQLKELKQNQEESLGQYYRRTHDILTGLGGEDREKKSENEDDVSFLLNYTIENFVDGLHDSQLRCKMRYKYLATSGRYLATSEWSLYGAYDAAEQISSTIASKKKALRDLYEEELLRILRTEDTEVALKFIKNSQPEPYIQQPKSIPVDRIERYRPKQHTKPERTMQNNIIKEDEKHDHRQQASKADDAIDINRKKENIEAASASKLTQPYIDESSSDSNVSALGRIPGGPQSTPHPDSTILENVMELPSQLKPICAPVSNEQAIRPEEPTEREKPTEIYASGPSKWPASTTLPESSIINESPPTLEEMPRDFSEISAAIENTSDTETMDEVLVSGPRKWAVVSTSLQKSSPEASIVNESPPVLKQMPCNSPETNASIVDISDTESKKDEILASGPSNWTAASAQIEEVFEPTVTYKAFSKKPSVSHIEKDIEAEAPDKTCAESIVDVETLNQEVFALAASYDSFSKNLPAPYSEDTEISTAVDMLSLEDLSNRDGSAIEAFDPATVTGTYLKHASMQHTEHSETLEKDSAYIELPALPAFDLSIDIDFETYSVQSVTSEVTYSSTQPPVTPSTPPVTLQATEETSVYGREQSSTCSAGYMTSCYEGEQVICSADTVDTTSDVTKPTVTKPATKSTVTKPVHHALLTYCLAWIQHTILPFCMIMWITIYDYAALLDLTTEYKARPKVKIKRLLEPKHIESRSQQTVAGIFAESTYKIALISGTSTTVRTLETIAGCARRMATSSGISTRVNTSGISAVFAYKMALFPSGLQELETFNFEVIGSAYGFGFRACKTVIWFHAIATRAKPYFYGFSTFSNICFTNPIASRTQRGLFGPTFGVKIAMRMGIYAACLERI